MRIITAKAIAENSVCVAEAITLDSGQRLVFRPLKANDAALLADYFLSLSPETRARFAPHPFTTEQAEKLCAEMDYERAIRLVAATYDVEQPEIVAYFILGFGLGDADQKRYWTRGTSLDQASVCTIAPSVSDTCQNCGLGSVVMERALALAHRLGRTRVVLQGGVQASNSRAVHFYERFGFQKVGSFSTTVENYDMILDLAQDTPRMTTAAGRASTVSFSRTAG
jgi:diamine N-acetyltransferase